MHVCKCENVKVQTYANAMWIHPPAHMPRKTGYVIDRCIVEEIIQLWQLGIFTTGSCCGHKTHPAYIGVIDEHIPKMKKLGYQVQPNPARPGDEDSFHPLGPIHEDVVRQHFETEKMYDA